MRSSCAWDSPAEQEQYKTLWKQQQNKNTEFAKSQAANNTIHTAFANIVRCNKSHCLGIFFSGIPLSLLVKAEFIFSEAQSPLYVMNAPSEAYQGGWDPPHPKRLDNSLEAYDRTARDGIAAVFVILSELFFHPIKNPHFRQEQVPNLLHF